jgi:hypothetical protein
VGVVGDGNVSGNFVILRRYTGNNVPGAARIFGVRDLGGHLVGATNCCGLCGFTAMEGSLK